MNALVTGGAGFLGSFVVERLLGLGARVAILDDLSAGRREHVPPEAQLFEKDIRDTGAVFEVFAKAKPEVVIHLAALHFIPACERDPARALDVNVTGLQNVLSATAAHACPRLFFASTGDVYAPSDTAHAETDRLAPFNVYGMSKLFGEQLCGLMAQRNRPLGIVVGRLFNLYGPRETNPHFIPELLRQAEAGATAQVGSLWPRRDLVPVADAARAVVELVMRQAPGVTTVNLASGRARSMQEVVEAFQGAWPRPFATVEDPARIRPVERAHLQADVSALRRLLGWTPHDDLARGLGELVHAHRV